MAHLFSPAVSIPLFENSSDGGELGIVLQNRFFTWRKLWLNLAIAEKQLGLPIAEESIVQMSNNLVRLFFLDYLIKSSLSS